MKKINIPGVFREKKQIFTENLEGCEGVKVYNEKIVKSKGREFRSWNPYRSKLAAAILNGIDLPIEKNSNILYLGAGTGTTVSHVSDIVKDGWIYAVENSPIAMKKFLRTCEKRGNIIPVFEDASHPDRYSHLIPRVDILYQDISQRNQAEIFVSNLFSYMKKDGLAVFMVKARSINVSLKPKEIYDHVSSYVKEKGLKVHKLFDLKPFEKDHVGMTVTH